MDNVKQRLAKGANDDAKRDTKSPVKFTIFKNDRCTMCPKEKSGANGHALALHKASICKGLNCHSSVKIMCTDCQTTCKPCKHCKAEVEHNEPCVQLGAGQGS